MCGNVGYQKTLSRLQSPQSPKSHKNLIPERSHLRAPLSPLDHHLLIVDRAESAVSSKYLSLLKTIEANDQPHAPEFACHVKTVHDDDKHRAPQELYT